MNLKLPAGTRCTTDGDIDQNLTRTNDQEKYKVENDKDGKGKILSWERVPCDR